MSYKHKYLVLTRLVNIAQPMFSHSKKSHLSQCFSKCPLNKKIGIPSLMSRIGRGWLGGWGIDFTTVSHLQWLFERGLIRHIVVLIENCLMQLFLKRTVYTKIIHIPTLKVPILPPIKSSNVFSTFMDFYSKIKCLHIYVYNNN